MIEELKKKKKVKGTRNKGNKENMEGGIDGTAVLLFPLVNLNIEVNRKRRLTEQGEILIVLCFCSSDQ